MEKKTLVEVSVVTDDDTCMWSVGELEFGINGRLKTYLEKDPIRRRDNVLSMLGFLSHMVCEETSRLMQNSEESQDTNVKAQCKHKFELDGGPCIHCHKTFQEIVDEYEH